MNENPAVSIYIITRLGSEERCEVLKRTCEAALAQRYSDFEVVVSDNAGDFSAEEALRSIQDPRLKIHRHEQNVGFTGNVYQCLNLCNHDIIKILCDDDLIHPDFLAHTVPWVNDETMVVAGVEKYVLGNDPDSFTHKVEGQPDYEVREAGYSRDIWRQPHSSSCIPSATVYTRSLFESLGGFDDKTSTPDWDFFIEACLYRRTVYVNETLCYVGIWPGSFTEEKLENPFFFPTERMYTKFRFYHGKGLSGSDRRQLLTHLIGEFLRESLRPIKHLGSKIYREGYRDYSSRFFKLLKPSTDSFSKRPSHS